MGRAFGLRVLALGYERLRVIGRTQLIEQIMDNEDVKVLSY